MLKSFAKILGGSNDGVIKNLYKDVDDINALEPEFESMSDDELRALRDAFKARLNAGEELDDLIPEVFAAVREASKRTLGMRHFDVQMIGGIVLHDGKIAEMRTGEGKTLAATLPSYLNSLTGEGVHVVTVNDYLARRDAQWMGEIYHFLGASVGILQHQSSYIYDPSAESAENGMEKLRRVDRVEAYAADITYGTNNEFGFDYLRDNMVVEASQRVQQLRRAYAIVDEVDNILIDEARTPLIISGPAPQSPSEYQQYARMVPNLRDEEDYTIDEKHRTAALTNEGISKLESILKIDNIYDPEHFDKVHYIENALKAQAIFLRDREYVVQNGEVIIVDEFTGRLMGGRRYSDGLHQAIEAKEGVQVQKESITYATITLQNYFRLYKKLAGMTGTASTEAEEFFKIYKLEVLEIPTNMPMIRDDQRDLIYKDKASKYRAVVQEIKVRHEKGQPVLVGTTDIDRSEELSAMLRKEDVPHEVLNAKHHESEASIVAQAGRPGAITVATNMAGRGTDIILGGNPAALDISDEEWQADHDRVLEVGGLFILGTERHEARRIDNQLRGRSGRQGDPGESRFYVALDDDLMRRFGGDTIKRFMDWALEDDVPIQSKAISKAIENAQVKTEAYHFDIRKHLVEYDDVVNTHRDVIYGEREKVLSGANMKANIQTMVGEAIRDTLQAHLVGDISDTWETESLVRELGGMMPLAPELSDADALLDYSFGEIEDMALDHAEMLYDTLEAELGEAEMRSLERQVMLRVVDSSWVQHLTAIESLRQGIGLEAFGQRDPLVMYKKKGHEEFLTLQSRIQRDIVYTIFHLGSLVHQQAGQTEGNGKPRKAAQRTSGKGKSNRSVMENVMGDQREAVASGSQKVGRNAACPCGSGKKYKRCHGA
ncbi:MAG: preprotein translocase subunit SecA [Chloroflexi bacterium]|nr:preprotein translocase subunit SecA [Chloroflexota bacterium]